MEWLRLLTFKTLKKRTPLTVVITVALSVIISLFISGYNAVVEFERAYDQRLTDIYGSYHAIFFNIYADKDNIYDSNIKDIGFFEVYGKTPSENAISDITLGYADQNALKLHNITLSSGRMPTSENEIVVEKWILRESGLDIELGKDITIDFTSLNGNLEFLSESSLNVKVVGIINDYSALHADNTYVEYEKALLPNILLGSPLDTPKINSCSVELYNINEYDYVLSYLNENVLGAGKYIKNSNRYETNNMSGASMVVKSTVNSMLVLIVLIGVFFIVLIQYLYTYAQRKNIEISELLGATKKQIRIYIFCINMLLALFAIIPGMVLGLIISMLFSNLLSTIFEMQIYNGISFVAILYSIALFIGTVLITSVINIIINNITQSSNKKIKTPALMPNTKSPYVLMSYKSILCSPSRFAVIAVLLAFCMTLSCFSVIYKAQSEELLVEDNLFDYNIYNARALYSQNLHCPLPYDKDMRIVAETFEQLCDDRFLSDYVLRFESAVNVLMPITDENNSLLIDGYNEVFEGDLDYGYKGCSLYQSELSCIDISSFDKLKNFETYGSLNMEAIAQGHEVIMCVSEQNYNYEGIGDKSYKNFVDGMKKLIGTELTLTQVANFEVENDISTGTRIDLPVTLGAIIIIPSTETKLLASIACDNGFVGEYSAFMKTTLNFNEFEYFSSLKSSDYADIFEARIKNLLKDYDNITVVSNNQNKYISRQTNLMIDSVIGGISIALCGFAVIFLIINYMQNALSKRRLYIQLYTIGASPKQINAMMLTEYVSCMIIAVMFAVVPVVILSYASYIYGLNMGAVKALIVGLGLPIALALSMCVPFYFWNKKYIVESIIK